MKNRMNVNSRILGIFCIISFWLCALPLTGCAQEAATTPVALPQVYWAEQIAGENRVIYPVISGLSDENIQNAINQDMFVTLHAGDMLTRLERIRQRTQEEQAQRTLYMEGDATVSGQLLSVMVRTRGEQYDGSSGDSVMCLNYDLSTGEQMTLDDLFTDPAAAKERMQSLIEKQVLPELSAYLANNDVLPLPEDSFYLDEKGIVFYYPQERFSMISGRVGACAFYYYEIREWLDTESDRFGTLFATDYEQADAAELIEKAVSEGVIPQLPFALDVRVGTYLETYPLINDPDYTLTSLVYQFEDPVLRQSGVETWVYDEAPEEERKITAIRSSRIDFYGIQVGISTLDECSALLGEPRETLSYDEEQAVDMLLTSGESLLYTFGDNELEIHADEQGIVSCVIVRAGAM